MLGLFIIRYKYVSQKNVLLCENKHLFWYQFGLAKMLLDHPNNLYLNAVLIYFKMLGNFVFQFKTKTDFKISLLTFNTQNLSF